MDKMSSELGTIGFFPFVAELFLRVWTHRSRCSPEGSVKFRDLGETAALARRTAAAMALLRGAQGEPEPVITQHGNTHDGRATGSLAYGGTVVAEVRYSHVK